MAKVLKALCVFFIVSIFVISVSGGCTGEKSEQNTIASNFKSDFDAEYRDMKISGSIVAGRQGIVSISISSPSTLDGLQINYKNSCIEIGRENLLCTADEPYLPSESFPAVVKSLLTEINNGKAALTNKNENCQFFKLISQNGEWTIETASDGALVSAQINNLDFSINFRNTEIL